jgi:hypothetical protein
MIAMVAAMARIKPMMGKTVARAGRRTGPLRSAEEADAAACCG